MPPITLVNATDLALWANRRDAQGTLPQLLRRLVHATVAKINQIDFLAGEGVQLGGWDGIVAVERGNAFVPDGISGWEVSAEKGIKGKADGDYEKRAEDPLGIDPRQSAFVFVTPRRWRDKRKWCNLRQREGVWREVRTYNADDLEAWLELAPAVHIWFSILLGKHPEGAIDIANYWEDWSGVTRPATTPEIVLAGRNEVVKRVKAWLGEESPSLALQAESREEACAVFVAALQQLPEDQRNYCLARTLIVRDLSAWYHLTALKNVLVIVPVFDIQEEALTCARRSGHQTVVPLGRADSPSPSALLVPRLSCEEVTKLLVSADLGRDRAYDLAMLARRSFKTFRRKLAMNPEVQQPIWARPEEARLLLPAMLAGSWMDKSDGDREVIAALAQTPYENVTAALMRWANENDPPVRCTGGTWYITAKDDAWHFLARYLTGDDLDGLKKVVLDVLGAPLSRFDLPGDQRWMANTLGKAQKHSDAIRQGLADTLAIMGAHPEMTLAGGISAGDYAAGSATMILQRANADWRVWASLSSLLPLLAEAAPDTMLHALDEGLKGDPPILRSLFTDEGDVLFSSSPHTGLLWALETLAWSQEYLGHAALILAKLAEIDPGGKLSNRPQNTLRHIFLPWMPQTSASFAQRLDVLDTLRQREPEVAWQLLRQLLPEPQSIGHLTAKPRWRDWAPDLAPPVTHGEYFRFAREVVTQMVVDVGTSGSRWQDLIEVHHRLPTDEQEAIVETLANIDSEHFAPSDRIIVWNALRKFISHHRTYPDAGWALQENA